MWLQRCLLHTLYQLEWVQLHIREIAKYGLKKCLSNCNEHINPMEILLKCRF